MTTGARRDSASSPTGEPQRVLPAAYIGYLAGMSRANLEAARDEYRAKASALLDDDPQLARWLLYAADDIAFHLRYLDQFDRRWDAS